MNKFTVILGTVLIIFSMLGVFYSLNSAINLNPGPENIIYDSSVEGDVFYYSGEAILMSVYAKGNVDCNSFEVSITDGNYDFFSRTCNSVMNEDGYTYLGDLILDNTGNYQIFTDNGQEIIIIDDEELAQAGLGFMFSGCICFLGFIIAVVGLIVQGKKPNKAIMYVQEKTDIDSRVETDQA
tara:strand:- start:7234 stop:7779 length:546 start_codon:yes stop_codon:yes gene_type:complete